MIARILVALDGSARAAGVFDAAAEMTFRFGATLYPFRAIFVPPEFPAAAAGSHRDPLPDYLSREATEELGQLVARVPHVVVAPPMIRVGQPWRLILQAADEIEADLIVLGSHGYQGWDRILGTTAGRVANLAHHDVLVVHDRSDRERATSLVADSAYRTRMLPGSGH